MDTPEVLREALFTDDAENVYAILDGACCSELLEQLAQHSPEYCCLYAGELEPDVEACAPHLVALLPDHPFTAWLLASLPGHPWGIFVRSPATLRQLRKHFRSFLIVQNEKQENLYFRYYDPRVLRIFLPTCDADQFQNFFGPVSAYLAEALNGDFVFSRYQDGKLQTQRTGNGTGR